MSSRYFSPRLDTESLPENEPINEENTSSSSLSALLKLAFAVVDDGTNSVVS
jgi:hypothetical protein